MNFDTFGVCFPPPRNNCRLMNLILFETSEVVTEATDPGSFIATMSNKDRRYIHCTTVLKVSTESIVRVGVIDGHMYDARVVELTGEKLVIRFDDTMMRKTRPFSDMNISVILACPRPKVLGRLWPVFSQLGFRRVFLIKAARVEDNYFGSHWMQADCYRSLLIKGLEQAAVSTRLPEISFDKRELEVFLAKRLDVAFPPEKCKRFICHPEDGSDEVKISPEFDTSNETVIALGPEGGWLDFEISALKERGFIPVTCSSRVFTTDVALIALTSAISCRLKPELMGRNI